MDDGIPIEGTYILPNPDEDDKEEEEVKGVKESSSSDVLGQEVKEPKESSSSEVKEKEAEVSGSESA